MAALVGAGLDPCETLVSFAADGLAEADALRAWRGWSNEEWSAATERLSERGLLDAAGRLTEAGIEQRAWVERRTDVAAMASWDVLASSVATGWSSWRPLVRNIVGGGGFRATNPMGLRPL